MADELYTVAPDGGLDIHFHEGQWRAITSEARWVAVIAGTQSGKTSFAPIWLHREIQRCGPGDYLFASPTFRLLEVKALPELLRFFRSTLRLGRFYRSPVPRFVFSREGCRRTFGDAWQPWMPPTQIYFGHAANSDSLESATYKAAVLDECGQRGFKQSSFEAVRRRLSIARGRALLCTTPFNLGWLKAQVFDRWQRGEPEYEVINFSSIANPVFSRAEYEEARRVLPKWRFEMFYDGKFSRPAGLIYDAFDSEKHVIPRFAIPADWMRIVGLDFGQANTAAVFLAERPGTRELYAYKEYGPVGGRTAKQHIAAMLVGEPIDPKTKQRIKIRAVGGSASEDDWRDEFSAAGLYVEEPPISDVSVGIDRVYGTMARGELRVFSDLERTLAQLGDYSYEIDEDHDYEVTDKIDEKERYHLCLVGGTMVSTDRGDVPIEKLRSGAMVLTRAGHRPVVCWARTGLKVPVLEVTFSDATTLRGTPEHPIFVHGKGWVPLDSLRYDDCIVRVEDGAWSGSSIRSSTESGTTATRTHRDYLTAAISSAKASLLTARCGSSIVAQSRTALMSTTLTVMVDTTRCPTSSSCRGDGTSRSIMAGRRRRRPLTSIASAPWPPSGTVATPGASGTPNTVAKHGRNEKRSLELAISVAPRSAASPAVPTTDSARTPASRDGVALRALITSSERVRAAVRPLGPTVTLERGSAPVRVLHVREAGCADVYSLSVQEDHEYFANGVLVSNCDGLRYGIAPIRTSPGPIAVSQKVRMGPSPTKPLPSQRPRGNKPAPPTMWDVLTNPSKYQPTAMKR